MKATKKQIQTEQIERHGQNLIKLFGLPSDTNAYNLCSKLRSHELKAERLTEELCNGTTEHREEMCENALKKIKNRVNAILKNEAGKIPVFINRDPRGYALKIQDEFIREYRGMGKDLYCDMGGFGILAPEFNGTY